MFNFQVTLECVHALSGNRWIEYFTKLTFYLMRNCALAFPLQLWPTIEANWSVSHVLEWMMGDPLRVHHRDPSSRNQELRSMKIYFLLLGRMLWNIAFQFQQTTIIPKWPMLGIKGNVTCNIMNNRMRIASNRRDSPIGTKKWKVTLPLRISLLIYI